VVCQHVIEFLDILLLYLSCNEIWLNPQPCGWSPLLVDNTRKLKKNKNKDLDAPEITSDMQAVAVSQRSATNAHDRRPCSIYDQSIFSQINLDQGLGFCRLPGISHRRRSLLWSSLLCQGEILLFSHVPRKHVRVVSYMEFPVLVGSPEVWERPSIALPQENPLVQELTLLCISLRILFRSYRVAALLYGSAIFWSCMIQKSGAITPPASQISWKIGNLFLQIE